MSHDQDIRRGLKLLLSGGLEQLSDEEMRALWNATSAEHVRRCVPVPHCRARWLKDGRHSVAPGTLECEACGDRLS